MYKIKVALIVLLLYACSNENNSEESKSIKNEKEIAIAKQRKNRCSDRIKYLDYELCVKDSLVKNVDSNYVDLFCYRSLLHYQRLVLSKKGTILKEIILPIPKTTVKLTNGKLMPIWNHRITDLKVITGKNGFLFEISGFEGCNGKDEFNSFLSSRGELVYIEFQGSGKVEGVNIGSWSDELKRIGCSEDEYDKDNFERVYLIKDGLKEFKGI